MWEIEANVLSIVLSLLLSVYRLRHLKNELVLYIARRIPLLPVRQTSARPHRPFRQYRRYVTPETPMRTV